MKKAKETGAAEEPEMGLKTSNCKFQVNSYEVPELTGSLNYRRLGSR